jgi:peptide/nickel transport system substrate-binding protein
VEKVDAYTIDIHSDLPNPVLVNQLTELRIMSKAWAEKNKSVEPKDIKTKDETLPTATRWAPAPTSSSSGRPTSAWCWSPTHWWGKGKYPTNLTEIVYTPIKADATRTAALLSGEVDL